MLRPFSNLFVVMLAVALLCLTGCGPRAQVLSDKVKNQLDELVGKLDVQKKEIENQLSNLDTAIQTLKKAKITNEVKLEQLDKKMVPLKAQATKIKDVLAKFSDHLQATESVEISGRTYTPDEIKTNLKELVAGYNQTDSKIKSYQPAKESLARVIAMQERQLTTYQSKQAEMKIQMDSLEARYEAVKVMREAQVTAGGEDFSSTITKMQDSIDDLSAEVETSLRLEDEKLKEMESEVKSSKLDELLQESDEEQLSKDLESILGK